MGMAAVVRILRVRVHQQFPLDSSDESRGNCGLGRGLPKNRLLASGSQTGLHVVRVEHTVLSAGDMNEDSMTCHTRVLARLGRHAHGLVARRMNWLFGEQAGFRESWHPIVIRLHG